jgi:hypothetical protein
MSYTNADGLYVLTNGGQGEVLTQGATVASPRQALIVDLDLTALGTTFGASNINVNNPFIPAGSVILSATLIMTDAATSGGAATLTIGTYDAAGTAIDADGIDATVALTAIDADGETVRCDGAHLTTAGYVAANAYIGAIYGTAAFTAGTAKLVVEYQKL